MNTASNAINVQITTNDILAICLGNCQYAFNTYTEITSLSYSGTTLSLALSDPTTVNFPINSISIEVGGFNCPINAGSSLSALTCTLRTNTDGTATLVTGSITPIVIVGTYGIAGLASGVPPLSIPLVATSLSLATGGNNGGYVISLNGKGFPLDKSKMTIRLCNNQATISSISNIKADFYVPACSSTGAQTVSVTVGSTTNTDLTFTYTDGSATAPTIISLSPSTANPTLKGTL